MPQPTVEQVLPALRVQGQVRPPGDKSISHRYAILGALARGSSRFTGFAPGADASATLRCLSALGVGVRERIGTADEGRIVEMTGCGLRGFTAPSGVLDTANSGTTMRLLAGVLSAHAFSTTLTGDASLRKRPMGRVIEPLRAPRAPVRSGCGRPRENHRRGQTPPP